MVIVDIVLAKRLQFFQTIRIWRCANLRDLFCRSRPMLQHENLLAKIGFGTAENELSKVALFHSLIARILKYELKISGSLYASLRDPAESR